MVIGSVKKKKDLYLFCIYLLFNNLFIHKRLCEIVVCTSNKKTPKEKQNKKQTNKKNLLVTTHTEKCIGLGGKKFTHVRFAQHKLASLSHFSAY